MNLQISFNFFVGVGLILPPFSILDYVASDDMMVNKFERLGRKQLLIERDAIPPFNGGTEENHEKPQSGYSVSWLRLKLSTSQI